MSTQWKKKEVIIIIIFNNLLKGSIVCNWKNIAIMLYNNNSDLAIMLL